jgi:molybdopterin molybdotransferase
MAGTAPITVREAQLRILERVRSLPAERVSVSAALGRVLAEAVRSRLDLPPWDNSAMDGYAVRCADVEKGVALHVALGVNAGADAGEALPEGAAARIMTGAAIPKNADAVIPVESSTGPLGKGIFAAVGESVRFSERPEPGANIRRCGEDVHRGATVLPAGAVCHGPQIAMAAATGHAVLSVVRRPRVAIVSTGDELADIGETRAPNRIVNGNAYGLAAEVARAGGIPTMLPIVPDQADATREAIASALSADVVITIGGVSMGERDHVRRALFDAGVELVFWRVALRPGGPMALGVTDDGRCVFALPGNPVSAHVTFELFVRPALLRLGGQERCFRRTLRARLAEPVRTGPDKAYYLRGRLNPDGEGWRVTSAGPQGSGVLSSLVAADGLFVVPEGIEDLPAGATVEVLPINDRAFMQGEVA